MVWFSLKYRIIGVLSQFARCLDKIRKGIAYRLSLYRQARCLKWLNGAPERSDAREVRLFAIMRNESLRISHFVQYYESMGVDRFFFIDNNSSDDCVSKIIKNKNVHVLTTNGPYLYHWMWMEHMLDKYGKGHWCMVVDIDELFYYHGKQSLTLRDFCRYLETKGETAVRSLLLDMYPSDSVNNTIYNSGSDPLNIVSYFDAQYFSRPFSFQDKKRMDYFTTTIFTGGMRDRVFGESNPPSILSKISLFRYLPQTYLVQGMHAINGSQVSEIQAVVFHTKFLSDFISEVKEECIREQHYGGAFYYKIFKKKIDENPELNFHFEGSVKFKDSQQLIDLGMMKTTDAFEKYIEKIQEDATQLDPS